MVNCYRLAGADSVACDVTDQVQLSFDERCRSRGKGESDNGMTVAWFFERGQSLKHGDLLQGEDGGLFKIVAAAEKVSKVTAGDSYLLMRIAYHLGNRHVPLQITPGYLLYQVDHVLDEMARGLGGMVAHCDLAFQPEDGAYAAHGHGHQQGHHHQEDVR